MVRNVPKKSSQSIETSVCLAPGPLCRQVHRTKRWPGTTTTRTRTIHARVPAIHSRAREFVDFILRASMHMNSRAVKTVLRADGPQQGISFLSIICWNVLLWDHRTSILDFWSSLCLPKPEWDAYSRADGEVHDHSAITSGECPYLGNIWCLQVKGSLRKVL